MPPDEAHEEETDAENWRQESVANRMESNRIGLNWHSVCGLEKNWGFGVLGFWGRSGKGAYRTLC